MNGLSGTGNVRVTGAINNDPAHTVPALSLEEHRETNGRVDDQRATPVIVGQSEGDLIAIQDLIASGYLYLPLSDLLINPGPNLPGYCAVGRCQQQVARLGVHAHLVQPVKGQTDLPRIGSGRNLEVIFQLAATAVEH